MHTEYPKDPCLGSTKQDMPGTEKSGVAGKRSAQVVGPGNIMLWGTEDQMPQGIRKFPSLSVL